MTNIADILNLENPILRGFLFYNALLVVKCMAMSVLTARQRFKSKVSVLNFNTNYISLK